MDPNPNPNPNPSPTQVDHSVTSGPRYTISYEHGAIVPPLVRAGRRRLCAYLASRYPNPNPSPSPNPNPNPNVKQVGTSLGS